MDRTIADDLIGKKITQVFMNEEYLKFVTDQGDFVYTVEGDCCSNSIFYDFYGVKKLFENGPVTAVKEVDLVASDIVEVEYGMKDKKNEHDDIKLYGYAITTENPQWGEMTSVFSFRNYSNGYYGGWMETASGAVKVLPEITDDVLETAPNQSNA